MNDHAKDAARLLRSIGAVDDRYVLEALSEKRRRRKPLWTGLAAAACAALVLTGGWLLRQTTEQPGDTEFVYNGNPIVEYATLEDAEAAVGFSIELPELGGAYGDYTVAVLDGQLLQISYPSADGTDACVIRKAAGSEDVSGDSNEYETIRTVSVGERTITLKGNDDLISVAAWGDDGYTYAVSVSVPVSEETMLEWISDIQ